MLKLSETNIWEKLSCSSDPAELPQLLKKCIEKPSKELIDEIHYYIYCQETLYQTTFAAFPYLVDICRQTQDEELRWYIILNLGAILCELDNEGKYFHQLMQHETIDKKTLDEIARSYLESFDTYKSLINSLLETAGDKDEDDKKWLLVTLAVANNMYQEGKVLSLFLESEECSCCCPECEAEFYLENNNGKLTLSDEDPIAIMPYASSETDIQPIFKKMSLYTNKLRLKSMQPIINDLFGDAVCPDCEAKFNIFKGILAYLS